MIEAVDLVRQLYAAFNNQDVDWPDGPRYSVIP
jgi:hypothetical protein